MRRGSLGRAGRRDRPASWSRIGGAGGWVPAYGDGIFGIPLQLVGAESRARRYGAGGDCGKRRGARLVAKGWGGPRRAGLSCEPARAGDRCGYVACRCAAGRAPGRARGGARLLGRTGGRRVARPEPRCRGAGRRLEYGRLLLRGRVALPRRTGARSVAALPGSVVAQSPQHRTVARACGSGVCPACACRSGARALGAAAVLGLVVRATIGDGPCRAGLATKTALAEREGDAIASVEFGHPARVDVPSRSRACSAGSSSPCVGGTARSIGPRSGP